MDFNSRNISTSHISKEPVIDHQFDLFLQELDILFKTPRGSVFGNREFGQSTEDLLWKTNMNTDYMKISITEQIKSSCYMNEYYKWSVDVKVLKGTSRDIGLIDIVIRDLTTDAELTTKKFQFR